MMLAAPPHLFDNLAELTANFNHTTIVIWLTLAAELYTINAAQLRLRT